jgi:hypothetical protein
VSKRKLVVPTTAITSSGTIHTSTLLKNADLEQLIDFKQINGAHNPLYDRIQKFIFDVSYLLLLSTPPISSYGFFLVL